MANVSITLTIDVVGQWEPEATADAVARAVKGLSPFLPGRIEVIDATIENYWEQT